MAHIGKHVCICVFVCMWCVYVCLCMHVCVVCVCVRAHVRTCIYVCRSICLCMHVYEGHRKMLEVLLCHSSTLETVFLTELELGWHQASSSDCPATQSVRVSGTRGQEQLWNSGYLAYATSTLTY